MAVQREDDDGPEMMREFIKYLKKILKDANAGKATLAASEMEVIRKLLADNSVTLASVRRGSFGDAAKKLAEEFPFQDGAAPAQFQ